MRGRRWHPSVWRWFICMQTAHMNLNNGGFSKCFMNSLNSVTKNICHYSKRTRNCHLLFEPAPARHMWETGSLNCTQFKVQWFIRFPECAEFSESSTHLGKTSTSTLAVQKNTLWKFAFKKNIFQRILCTVFSNK